MFCREISELLPGYAVGALNSTERELVDRHLDAGCAPCSRELAALIDAAAALAESGSPVAPPANLKSNLMERVAEHEKVGLASHASCAASQQRTWWAPHVAAALAAAIVGVLAHQVVGTLWTPDHTLALENRIAETDRVLGVPETRLVSVDAESLGRGLDVLLLYDELSGQLHVLVSDSAVKPASDRYWVWVKSKSGIVLSHQRLAGIGPSWSGAVLDLPKSGTGAEELSITHEVKDTPSEPGGETIGRVRIEFSKPW